MDRWINRREFLGAAGTAAAWTMGAGPLVRRAWAAASTGAVVPPAASAASGRPTPRDRVRLRPFDYQGVALTDSPWQRQAQAGRDYYMSLADDDVLHGYRVAAGDVNPPGRPLGGWASPNSNTVFGQWLQAMARMQRAYGDREMLEKAGRWVSEWARCWPAMAARGGGRGRGTRGAVGGLGHYPYEKLVGGLVDMHLYGGHPDALRMCGIITEAAIEGLNRDRIPAAREPWELHSGRPLEWYTVAENLYRAYQVSGEPRYREFADVWLYRAYWDKFAETNDPTDAHGVHAYSHCNSFSSAAMAYEITGDPYFLTVMKNFYDFMQRRQTYATGGYGPNERIVFSDGALGDSLEVVAASFECPCCTWAAFKLAKYLMLFTGEARYGDWIEKLLYNGIGAALPIVDRGKHFYYADYHLGACLKYYSRNAFTCCSGTYFQNIAEYSNLIYFFDEGGLYINLYVPSEARWRSPAGADVRLTMTTGYPEAEAVTIRLAMERPARFALKLRVPGWSPDMSVKVNGTAPSTAMRPGEWAAIEREWQGGDTVDITIPLRFRRVPIDEQHPQRVALVRGPLVYAQEDVHKWLSEIPDNDEDLNRLMRPLESDPAIFQIANEPVVGQRNAFVPYYRFGELVRHRLYHDPKLRRVLW